jgi:hypothetical protein
VLRQGAQAAHHTPTPYIGDYEPLALGWYLVARASKVEVQSLSGGRSAISALFASVVTLDGGSAPNPFVALGRGWLTLCRRGAARPLLGTTLLGLWVYAPISPPQRMGLLGLLGNPNNTSLYAAYSLASTNHPPPGRGHAQAPAIQARK